MVAQPEPGLHRHDFASPANGRSSKTLHPRTVSTKDEGTWQLEATATARTQPKQSAYGQPMTAHRQWPTHDLAKGRSDLGKKGPDSWK
jgi:hypothetical protein